MSPGQGSVNTQLALSVRASQDIVGTIQLCEDIYVRNNIIKRDAYRSPTSRSQSSNAIHIVTELLAAWVKNQ